MSETDNGPSEASEPTVDPAEKPKIYSSGKQIFKKVAPVKTEVIPGHLPSDQVGWIRTSLEHDHGISANDLPNSDELIISTWAAIVTKTGTFADALKALGD